MEQLLTPISSEELFGAASQLATPINETASTNIAALGPLYQVATGVVALLFIFIVVRYFSIFVHLISLFVRTKSKRPDIHIYSAEINNIEIFTSLAGLFILSLFVMRCSIEPMAQPYLGPLTNFSAWTIGGLTLAAISGTILFEWILLSITRFISERGDLCQGLWHIKLLHFSTIITIISPLVIWVLLTDGPSTKIAIIASLIICSISLILFILETFLFFRSQGVSIFHWILYLCTLEIFPLSLLLAPIVREGL